MVLSIWTVSCSKQEETSNQSENTDQNKPVIFVSVNPQAYFVERICGDLVDVRVMVGPGQSPATYEPTPKQMVSLSEAEIYFSIGVPFETAWMDKIKQLNPDLKIIDTRNGIELRNIETHHDNHENHNDNSKDPHIWLDPELVKIQAQTMKSALSDLFPDNQDEITENLDLFLNDLESLTNEIKQKLENLTSRKFLVFHPSWGYFADRFELEQIPIEIEGKEPSARELGEIFNLAKKENLKVIFIQEQFSTKSAESIASSIGAKVVSIDPLARDYMENMRNIARIIEESLK